MPQAYSGPPPPARFEPTGIYWYCALLFLPTAPRAADLFIGPTPARYHLPPRRECPGHSQIPHVAEDLVVVSRADPAWPQCRLPCRSECEPPRSSDPPSRSCEGWPRYPPATCSYRQRRRVV